MVECGGRRPETMPDDQDVFHSDPEILGRRCSAKYAFAPTRTRSAS